VNDDDDDWRRCALPLLESLRVRKVAGAVGVTGRRARDWLQGQ